MEDKKKKSHQTKKLQHSVVCHPNAIAQHLCRLLVCVSLGCHDYRESQLLHVPLNGINITPPVCTH